MTPRPLPRRARAARSLGALLAAALLAGALTACGPVDSTLGIRPAPSATPAGALSATRAAEIATALFAKAATTTEASKAGDAARAEVYTGVALTAANASATLAKVLTPLDLAARATSGEPPVVIAVSAGPSFPRQMVVRTTLKNGLPVLHLLISADVRSPYRIAASATMLPGASVRPFAPLSGGSEPVGDGTGLSVTPGDALSLLPPTVVFPGPTARDPRLADDTWSQAIRAAAKAKAAALGVSATLAEAHKSRGALGGLRTADGGGLVFVVLDRTDTLVPKAGIVLTPTAAFTALTGLKEIRKSAGTATLEFLAIEIPASGAARVVAATEQLYAASGS